jgi:transcription elongation factor Elf1
VSNKSHKHQYTVEILYHFSCGVCDNWWSWAQTPFVQPVDINLSDKKIYCPHCGHTQKTEIKEGFWLENLQNSAEKT